MICATEQEGLVWGQSYKLEPVAYGIMKLVMTCSIVDSLVLMDDVTDKVLCVCVCMCVCICILCVCVYTVRMYTVYCMICKLFDLMYTFKVICSYF
jgi:hypothetical protein